MFVKRPSFFLRLLTSMLLFTSCTGPQALSTPITIPSVSPTTTKVPPPQTIPAFTPTSHATQTLEPTGVLSTRKLAFVSKGKEGDELYLMNEDSLKPTYVAGMVYGKPIWSPQGDRMAYITTDVEGRKDLYILEIDSLQSALLIKDIAPFSREIFWDSTGNQLAFTSDKTGIPQIFLVNTSTGKLTQLTEADSFEPSWSYDGTQIVFCSTQAGDRGIYVVDLANKSQINLTQDAPGVYYNPVWSPTRNQIAFIDNDGVIYSVNSDGSEHRKLVGDLGVISALLWSPDGKFLTLVAGGDSNAIYLLDPATTSLARLTTDPGYYAHPQWSSDSKFIVFDALLASTDNFEIYSIKVDGSGLTNLTNDPANDIYPVWQP